MADAEDDPGDGSGTAASADVPDDAWWVARLNEEIAAVRRGLADLKRRIDDAYGALVRRR